MVLEKAQEDERLDTRDGPNHFMSAQEPDWNLSTGAGRLMNKQDPQLTTLFIGQSAPDRRRKLQKWRACLECQHLS